MPSVLRRAVLLFVATAPLVAACRAPASPSADAAAPTSSPRGAPEAARRAEGPALTPRPETRTALAIVVRSSEPLEARRAALRDLAGLHDPAAVLPLTAMLDGAEGSAELEPDIRAVLPSLGAPAVLGAMLASTSTAAEVRALRLIGNLGDRALIDPVRAKLASPSAKVREQASATLGRLGDPSAITQLAAALDDASEDVRMAAAQSLGQLGGDEARAALRARLAREGDAYVKLAIERALAIRPD